jgi:cytochrome c oxidase cbb3-type subunit III
MSSQASLFIVAFTLVNILACVWILWWTGIGHKKKDGSEPDKTGHVWDGDLEEYNNPLPRWWLGLFLITVVFGLGYLVLYPGLGNFPGTKNWSQVDQWQAQVNAQRAKFEDSVARLANMNLRELSQDTAAMSTAKNLFGQNCAQCHGSDARGAKGFPNLTDKDWLWGSQEDTVLATISEGRQGMMPPWGEVLGEQGVEEVATYVYSLTHADAPADKATAGKERFVATCSACHGADARGNPLMGAPNLADNVWLYGGDISSLKETIVKGRQNQMPAHLNTLGETRVRLLAAYVLSLGGTDAAVAAAPATPAVSAAPSIAAIVEAAQPAT